MSAEAKERPVVFSPEGMDANAIAHRHAQDDHWFASGLHDPNGYVGMAHKDRGDLLRWLRSGEATQRPANTLVISQAAFDWLMGAGPDDLGKHFGEDLKIDHLGNTLGGRFWWRTTFRRMCGL